MNLADFLSHPIWQKSFLGNTVKEYAMSFFILVFSVFLLKIFKKYILKKLEEFSKKTKTDLDDFLIEEINKLPFWFYGLIGAYISVHFLELPSKVMGVFHFFVLLFSTYFAVRFINSFIVYGAAKIREANKEKLEDSSIIIFLS
jgi:hypothetical protein